MGIGAKLTRLMKELGTNTNELSKKAGVPAATIYSLIRRDASKVDIDSLIKIARTLGVSADYFCSDDITIDICSTPLYLSQNEKELLNKYRELNLDGKKKLLERAQELQELGYSLKGDITTTA
ncbi:MAG: helix-turn-helix domain-containing protein [Agathobacter sp.]